MCERAIQHTRSNSPNLESLKKPCFCRKHRRWPKPVWTMVTGIRFAGSGYLSFGQPVASWVERNPSMSSHFRLSTSNPGESMSHPSKTMSHPGENSQLPSSTVSSHESGHPCAGEGRCCGGCKNPKRPVQSAAESTGVTTLNSPSASPAAGLV